MKTTPTKRAFLRLLALSFGFASAAISQASELVVNGTFEAGNSGFSSAYTYGNVSPPQSYVIGNNPATAPGHYSDWASFGDHTSGSGLMMIINGGTDAIAPFWSETVSVSAGQSYAFSFFAATINTTSASPASIQLLVNGTAVGSPLLLPTTGGKFVGDFGHYTATSGSATLSLVDLNTNVVLNDFVVDDISFKSGQHSVPESGAPGCALLAFGLLSIELVRRRLV